MPWARLDDGILDNPKVAAAGPIGFALHAAAIVYCSRNLTDGFIPYGHARRLLPTEWTMGPVDEERGAKVYTIAFVCGMGGEDGDAAIEPIVQLLVRLGLWEVVPHGYQIHDYLEYNPSKEQVLADRAAAKEAKAAGGKARAHAASRDHGRFTSRDPAKPAGAPAEQPAAHQQTTSPIPVPVPVVSLKDLEDRAKKRGVDPTTIPERLAGLRDQLEKKGVRYWLAYVVKQPEAGKSCLFDREVSRWLAEDHQARKTVEQTTPDIASGLHLRRIS